jgi:hypothetical protein
LLDDGRLTVAKSGIYPLVKATDALQALADRVSVGKFVLDLR